MVLSTKILKNKKLKSLKLNSANVPQLLFLTYEQDFEEELQEKTSVKKKKKTTWIFLLCNLVIVAAIFIYQFCFNETKPISELLAEKPFYRFFFISLGLIGVFYIVDAICYSALLKQVTGKFNFSLGLQLSMVGKYWDNITPFGSGGQFAQVAHGRKKGVSGDVATSVVVGKYMIWMIAFVILGLVALFFPIDTFVSGNVIKILALVGVIVNLLLTLFVWLVSVNRKICSVIVIGGIKILYKMHIIKNYSRAIYKSMRFVKQYQKAFKFFVKKPWVFISQVLLGMIELIALNLVAFMIYLAFNPQGGVSVFTILAMSFLCTFATSIIPIPGGSGAAEISFAALFGKLFTEGTTFWALIIWRVFTYYLLIVVGFIYTLIDPLILKRKISKKRKRAS